MKPFWWGLKPPPMPSAPWQATQSRSVWQLTHWFRFRSASKEVPGPSRRVAPDRLRWMEPGIVLGGRRARLADADAEVAIEAEALVAVARLAVLGLHPRLDGVHVQVVARVDRARPDPPVVAVGAEVFLVAVGAELRVVGGHRLV